MLESSVSQIPLNFKEAMWPGPSLKFCKPKSVGASGKTL